MATEAPTKPARSTKAKAKDDPDIVDDVVNDDDETAAGKAEDAADETDEALEILEPKADPKRWVIGKPPEHGGKETEYSVYVQKPLSYFARLRFFGLITRTIATALKQSGGLDTSGIDAFDYGDRISVDSLRRLREADFASAGNFFQLAMQLMSYQEDFLLDCYVIWLDVPASERRWAKAVLAQRWDPEAGQWGLTDAQGTEIVEIFIDQNYEDIRDFFAVELPKLWKRVQQREDARSSKDKARESA